MNRSNGEILYGVGGIQVRCLSQAGPCADDCTVRFHDATTNARAMGIVAEMRVVADEPNSSVSVGTMVSVGKVEGGGSDGRCGGDVREVVKAVW